MDHYDIVSYQPYLSVHSMLSRRFEVLGKQSIEVCYQVVFGLFC